MKKNLVILLGGYKPLPSPSGLIMQGLIEEFKKEYHVTVVAYKNDDSLNEYEEIDGVTIFRIKDYNKLLHNRISKKKNSAHSVVVKKIYSFLLFIKRIAFYTYRCCRSESITKPYVGKVLKKIRSIDAEINIDTLISVVEPHENSAAALCFKKEKPEVKWVIYQLDRFSNANSLYELKIAKNIKKRRHLKREIEYLQYCDGLFALNPISEHYECAFFDKYRTKIFYTDHPLLIKPKVDILGSASNVVNMIYAGSLDKTLRNPSIPIKSVVLASQMADVRWEIYCFGNCDSIVNKFSHKYPEVITYHPPISRDELVRKISASDILVNIGNNSANEIPSKFFDYLSYGLPIIHFYYNDKDQILEYLKKYPFALCVKIDSEKIEVEAKRIADFVNRTKKERIDFDVIKNTYIECTPQYVYKQFIKVIEPKF